jgi:histidinol phosphatase-like enzyme (inositol monophosphatase family)
MRVTSQADDSVIAFASALADEAGRIVRPMFRAPVLVHSKQDESPVTRADKDAELAMRALIARTYPDHGILGEEFGHENAGAPWCWVLDPIDGTRAFITGRPSFGTLIGLLHDGVPVLGVIDQPVTGERWIGVRGRPTLFTSSLGGQIGTRPCSGLADAELSATSPEMFGDSWPGFQRLSSRVRRTSWGGDCYAYGLLALGQIDIIAECGLKPWDWAALVPVVTGAGGRLVDWQGRALTLASTGHALAVGDARLLEQAIAAMA